MEIRNIAIIAHVDHGKTTLVDSLLRQSENFKLRSDAAQELIMDSNELERERGITIFSKNASIFYRSKNFNPHTNAGEPSPKSSEADNQNTSHSHVGVGVKINIVDTPGHADFGGEVERIMRMVDGVLLLVDAKEGPMPQTKFVLRKAIQAGHKIIVVINKIDKPNARPEWVLNATYELFIELGASETQIEFPIVYASAVQGKAGLKADLSEMKNVEPLFEKIISYIPAPVAELNKPLQMLTVSLIYDNYKGKIAIGRLYSGVLKKGMNVAHINRTGEVKKGQLSSIILFEGLNRVDVNEAYAGDIVGVAGISDISIGETIADPENPVALPIIHIDEPTIKMTFSVNTSPFAGKEGEYTTSRNIKERLEHELETDVALSVDQINPDKWVVAGRGELHLAILIEKMRREGYELEASKPQVIFKEKDGKKLEPIELVSVEAPENYSGVVIELMGKRLGIMKDMRVDGGEVFMDFAIPTRGLIGIRNEFLTSTKGMGIMNSIFLGYEDYRGELRDEPHGSIVATEAGVTNNYGLVTAQERGKLFLGPGVEVYEGMVVGQNAKAGDIAVHVCRTRQLTNFRSKNEGLGEQMEVPVEMTLEDALNYISDDELVEVTPKSIRIRKKFLNENERKKIRRDEKNG